MVLFYQPLQKKIKNRNSGNIKLLGQQEDLSVFWSDIDILILPSFAEGVPLVAIESLSKNVPLILMNLKNYQGIFSKDESVFIDSVNEETLILSFEKIFDDYNKYSYSAGETYLNKFNFVSWIKKISHIYGLRD